MKGEYVEMPNKSAKQRKQQRRKKNDELNKSGRTRNQIIKNNPSLVLQDGPVGGKRKQAFGKTKKLNSMSNEELKRKLHSVGINVTKLSKSGKRLNLTRKEMERKAITFKNLQIRAKKIGIKLMYKSKRRGYIYKSYTRLMNELNKMKMKMKTKMKTKTKTKMKSKFG